MTRTDLADSVRKTAIGGLLGLPLGIKLGRMHKVLLFAGYELELPFNYKEKRYANEKKEDKGEDLGLSNMDLNRVMIGPDGSLVVVGEKRYITVQCVTDSRGNTRCYNVYHADDLLVASIGADGALDWMSRVPKRMQSGIPIGASYKYMHGDGAHHFVHFDRSKDLDIRSDEPPTMKGDLLIVADRLNDATGSMERQAILNPDEVKGVKLYQLSMERLTRTSSGEILMEAYKKQKEDVLVRITVKE